MAAFDVNKLFIWYSIHSSIVISGLSVSHPPVATRIATSLKLLAMTKGILTLILSLKGEGKQRGRQE